MLRFYRSFSACRAVLNNGKTINPFDKLADKQSLLTTGMMSGFGMRQDKKSNILVSAEDMQLREEVLETPIRGVQAGRTVGVINGDTATAVRRLTTKLIANGVPMDKRKQRFHMKPGKAAELKRSQRHRRDFKKGFKRLIEIVKDARRKGY
ncbi:Ribosomal protein S21 [Nakaseomyces glabratus]